MVDYRRFLSAGSQEVAPYFGGPFVELPDRRLRLAEPVAPGYWRFAVSGRTARAVEPSDPPDLSDLPVVRGHYTDGYLVHEHAELLALPGAALGSGEEPPRFAPLAARRWPTGALLGELVDFESEAEEAVRRAFEEHRPVAGIHGVPASLRAAYAYAAVLRVATELGITMRPAEVRSSTSEIAAGGDLAARQVVRERQAQRSGYEERTRAGAAAQRPNRRTGGGQPAQGADRAAAALGSAGATVLAMRSPNNDLLEVRYLFRGERFTSIVHADTLQVADAGICLDGEDHLVTLDSLPSVLAEAMDREILWRT